MSPLARSFGRLQTRHVGADGRGLRVSVANGVMYAGSYAGQMYALDTITGNILWSFESGGSVLDGPSIVGGTVYWGSGYRENPARNRK